MSRLQSTRRRIALLATSSLAAAGLSTTLAMSLAVAPTAALAQSVTCAATPLPADDAPAGNGTGTVVLDASTYNPGVTCDYTGAGATVETNGAITVSTTGSVPADPLVNGVNLAASGASEINWDSSAGAVTGSAATNGPVIEAISQTGAINITTGAISRQTSPSASAGNSITDGIRAQSVSGAIDIEALGAINVGSSTQGQAGIEATTGGAITIDTGAVTGRSHGIFAESTGGGNVSVSVSGNVSGTNSVSGEAGIEARSIGGGDVVITKIEGSSPVSVLGRLYGIRAEATGAGDLTISLQGQGAIRAGADDNGVATSAAIYAKTGAGLLQIDADSIGQAAAGGNASGLRIETGGDAILNIGSLQGNGAVNANLDMTVSSGTLTVVNTSLATGLLSGNGHLQKGIAARGAGDLELNFSSVRGQIDLTELTGDVVMTVTDEWRIGPLTQHFSGGADAVTVGPDGFLAAFHSSMVSSSWGDAGTDAASILDFGDGQNAFTNRGLIGVGTRTGHSGGVYDRASDREGELRFEGLQTFRNSGTIILGVPNLRPVAGQPDLTPADIIAQGTDHWFDDILVIRGTGAAGATFIAEAGSRILLDADLSADQSACDASLRNADGDMPAADCVAIPGGSTEGVTQVYVHRPFTGDRGGATRVVLVDVSGGTSNPGDFVLDPTMLSYNADQGGYIDLGYFIYPLVYDPDTQQHVLLGAPGQNAWQSATWAQAAHDLWRVSTRSWFDRQADLRGGLTDDVGGGVWMRVSGEQAERDVVHAMTAGASTFAFDNSFEQQTYAVTGGLDLMVGGGGDTAWVVGVMAGYANTELTYDPSPNTVQLDGWTGGGYASFLSGGLFVDAAVNATKADIKADMPALNLSPAGTLVDGRLLSVGAQVDAGWRFPLSGGLFVEPVAGLSYVRTKWDDTTIPSDDPLRPGVVIEFDDPTSLRANVGARLGLDQDYGTVRAQYTLLGRVWNEFEGENSALLSNIGDDAFVTDEFTGQFSEFGVGVSLYGLGEALTGFVNFGGKFGDDYRAQNATVGVRVNW